MAGIPEAWKLSAEARAKIFQEQIAPHEVIPHISSNHKTDGKRPLAVIVVGQTGAGKTRLAPDLLKAMFNAKLNPAHFIADTYKTYHPYYAECLQKAPEKASILAGLDARIWLTMACEYAVAERIDVLVESACRHPDDFCKLAKIFYKGGFKVRVAILAVPEALSRLGILVRYHRNLPEARSRNLPLRLTPKKVHDDSYAGLASVAQFVDEDPAADIVIVVRRNNMLSYQNERMNEGRRDWLIEPGAYRSVQAERFRDLSADEKMVALQDIEELRGLQDPTVDDEIAEIESFLAALEAGHHGHGPFPPLELLDADEFIAER